MDCHIYIKTFFYLSAEGPSPKASAAMPPARLKRNDKPPRNTAAGLLSRRNDPGPEKNQNTTRSP